ncbi:MAG: thioredoxin [Pseudomonas sp.]|uniref:thioredoxin n=1 Tax=Pseudomonas sp. TaxID=306 RepID=UPI003390C639
MIQLELSDFDADRSLLALPGTSLVIFTSIGCAACRWVRLHLSGWGLPVQRLCWIDAADNGGLVQRYEVLGLPALFVVHNGQFHGALSAPLKPVELALALAAALQRPAEELP